MGHRHDAIEALRAYVADLEPTITDGVVGRAGAADDGDISVSGRVFGAPHFGLLAGVAGVAIVGLIGVPAAFGLLGSTDSGTLAPTVVESGAGAASSPLPLPTGGATAERAVYVLAAAGLTDAARVVSFAIATGLDTDPDVRAAIEALLAAVEEAGSAAVDEPSVVRATDDLVEATRPPGLTPDRMPPGVDDDTFTPPGQDDTFTPPGQDDTFTPPGQDDTFTPPGQDDTFTPPGRDDTFIPRGRSDGGAPPANGGGPPADAPEDAVGSDKDVKGNAGGADT